LPAFQTGKIVHVGGPFAVLEWPATDWCDTSFYCREDTRRVWRFDTTLNAWRIASSSPNVPSGAVSRNGVHPWLGVVDGSRLLGNSAAFAVFTLGQRVYSWNP